MTLAPNCWTWSLSSSIPPEWCGLRACREFWSLKPCAAKAAFFATKNGQRFMEKYDPKRMELSTRDVVARSIYTEVREGRGSEHGGAYLDISHKPAEYVKQKLPSMYHQFKELADVDITKGPMEVGPTCHYMMGGIKVEAETAASSLPGLFAAGEAPPDSMARTAWAETLSLTCWCSAAAPDWALPHMLTKPPAAADRR